MSNIIQSLWIGPELSNLEKLCLKSFIDNGHEFHLYTYCEIKNIPEGVIIKDANEILNENEIFKYKNGSVSAFSNLFRLTMLYKKGGYWVDTDVICVRPFNFDEEIVIASEPTHKYTGNTITSCFIKMPQNCEVALAGMNIQIEHKKLILTGQMQWGSGPKTMKELVQKFNLNKYVKPWRTVCSCGWDDYKSLLQPNYNVNSKVINTMDKIPEDMICIHLWHEKWRSKKIDKNKKFDPESLYELFKKKHNID